MDASLLPKPTPIVTYHNYSNGSSIPIRQPTPTFCQEIQQARKNDPHWVSDFSTVISHGKGDLMLRSDIFSSDLIILHRLFNDPLADVFMKLTAAAGIADLWDQLNKKHPSDKARANFEAWTKYFTQSWNSVDMGQAWDVNDKCIATRNLLYGLEKNLNSDYANTPEGKTEAKSSPHCYDPIDLIAKGMALKGKLVCGRFRVIQKIDEKSYLVGLPYTGEPSIDNSSFVVFGNSKTDSDFDYYDNEMVNLIVIVAGTYSYLTVTGANATVIKLKDWKKNTANNN